MRRFEYSDDVSSKFWQVDQAGNDLHIGFGKIGTAGQRQCKSYADNAGAGAAMEKLIREKIAKGYADMTGAAPAPAPASQVAPAAPLQSTVIANDTDSVALAALPPGLASLALPSRRHLGAPPASDTGALWQRFCTRARTADMLVAESSAPDYADAVNEALARIESGQRTGSQASDVVLLVVERELAREHEDDDAGSIIDAMVADHGLPYAFDALLLAQRAYAQNDYSFRGNTYGVRDAMAASGYPNYRIYSACELALRAHLAHAGIDVWEQCVQAARRAAPALRNNRLPLLAALLPDAPQLADDLALMLTPTPTANGPEWHANYAWLILYASAPEARQALRLWPRSADNSGYQFHGKGWPVATALQDRGMDAYEALSGGAGDEVGSQALACIGTVRSMTALARAAASESLFDNLCAAGQRWPDAAMTALAELIGRDHCGPVRARRALAAIVAQHAGRVPALLPSVSAPARKLLSAAAASHLGTHDCASAGELPPVLANPPWKSAAAKQAAPLALAPLPLAPIEHWSDAERAQLAEQRRYRWHYVYNPDDNTEQGREAVEAIDPDGRLAAWVDCVKPGRPFQEATRAIAELPAPMNAQVWNAVAHLGMFNPGQAIARLGLAALPSLVGMCMRSPALELPYAMYFGAVELAAPVARAHATLKGKTSLATARSWLLRYPEYAACGLAAPALGAPGPDREHARRALRMLAASGQRDLLLEVAVRYGQEAVTDAMRAMLDEDPLRLHPAKIGKLPAFWTPQAWARPLLAANGKALPTTALDAIGVMLRFPHVDGVYPGVTQLKQACTPGSLADFAWELFRAWIEDGARPKEDWAFYALGLLGDDDSARRLTPLIRAWPGEQLHARAATGLDVLALIGSDTALMHLNGIAQKLKFKGLQERAREKINEIAEARGLSTEELEDRLAPDLGLDEQGTVLLDFGPRQFRVGFDEALKPFVRMDTSARLADLPKPQKTDDAALSKQAVERFKLLKKDARTIAAQQVLRLESAMCTQRRWHPHAFRAFLATHPLLRHLVQRLVWGTFSTDGDRLLACFRATVDGSFTDAGDDAIDLPDGDSVRIGVPHALDLAPGDATAFGQLFADYELLQPFAQIGRDTYHLEAGESGEHALRRWEGRSVTTGALLGLLNRGWRRGEAQDGGSILDFRKPLGGGAMASLGIAPGIVVGMMREGEVQTLDPVVVGRVGQWDNMDTPVALGTLPAVVVSELIRDLQSMGA